MAKMKNLVLGYTISPMVAALLVLILAAVTSNDYSIRVLLLLPAFYIYSLLALGLIATPIFLVFVRLKYATWWSTILIGVVTGALIDIIFTYTFSTNSYLIYYSFIGAITSLVFWILYGSKLNIKANKFN